MILDEILAFIRNVPLGEHVSLFYDYDRVKWDLISEFINSGLARNHAVFYSLNSKMKDDHRKILKEHGVDVEAVGFYNADRNYLEALEGKTPPLMGRIFSMKEKRVGVRLVGNTAPTLLVKGHVEAGLIIERAVGNKTSSLPITILCPFNNRIWNKVRQEEGPELMKNLLRAHSYAVFPGIVLRLYE